MKTSDFYFELPNERVAQYPAARGESRLLVLERATGRRSHHMVKDLPGLLESGSLMVFNDSRVRKARIFGTDRRGRAVEFLLLHRAGTESSWEVITKKAGRRTGERFRFAGGEAETEAELQREGPRLLLCFDRPVDDAWLDIHGRVPLPPYIKRADEASDSARYQTVYARAHGSAAAPTAGLHFTDGILSALHGRGVGTAFVTLHVGLGTFLPVRGENVEDHRMHKEYFCIESGTAAAVEAAKRDGRKVVAVGTTTLRALESAWRGGAFQTGEQSTDIFIYGTYRFKTADALFTNFHTPCSTLLMLVCAFAGTAGGAAAGRKMIMETYREAIQKEYNFFSYGDAMLIL
ncbi:MAG: tRNA preQ1(34) S-adenosylmethionine ribosyltransferase-isomerase QueA [Spirochaetaceae bacterium]|jgi:S-adenosylmethionine:tRNA ribosyltransferase-isomerase|nr:tRNA preQ1(34) S-adenosylmethionine ribosyltransferase-isomerase QueA [Spirochaetaceae bacterium]